MKLSSTVILALQFIALASALSKGDKTTESKLPKSTKTKASKTHKSKSSKTKKPKTTHTTVPPKPKGPTDGNRPKVDKRVYNQDSPELNHYAPNPPHAEDTLDLANFVITPTSGTTTASTAPETASSSLSSMPAESTPTTSASSNTGPTPVSSRSATTSATSNTLSTSVASSSATRSSSNTKETANGASPLGVSPQMVFGTVLGSVMLALI